MTAVDLHAILPELILTGALLAVLVIDLFLPPERKALNAWVALAGVLGAGIAVLTLLGDDRTTFAGMYQVDSYAILFKLLFVGAGAIVILMSETYLDEEVRNSQGEFYFLLLASLLGMMVMPSARDMLALFVALETVSIPGFIMAGFRKSDGSSNEAAVKFFLFGVLSTTVMLFGMSMIYGLTGSTNLAVIGERLADGSEKMVVASILLIVVGFAFKVSAAPFHFWAPDTYEGSPVPVAAFLSVASKAAGFAGLLQVCFVAFPTYAHVWAPGFAVLAAITMTLGNVVALVQTNVVRLLAYSSIAQAGYMLLPFAVVSGQSAQLQRDAFAASLTYILIYSIMNLGAFAVVVAVGRKIGHDLSDYDGLSAREPGLAMAMLFFLLALAGMIPTAGFWAKFFVFRTAIESGTGWLAWLMVLNTLAGLYYYLSLGARMFLRQPSADGTLSVPRALAFSIVVLAAAVAIFTVFPDAIHHFSPRSTLVAL